MEQRKHPRIQLPLLVELQHPAVGHCRCVARDISEGGVYLQFRDERIGPGAKLKLRVLNPNSVDASPTPTVELEVRRIDEQGMGLEFLNRTGRHLWQSVGRLRSELEVGRDYYQVHVSALAVNPRGELLLVQQHGKWSFPGLYLTVGQPWRVALEDQLAHLFALKLNRIEELLGFETDATSDLPEAAVARLYALVTVDDSRFRKPAEGRIRACRWINRRRDIEDSTFVDDQVRNLAGQALEWSRLQGAE
ncbi:MAG: PilZ domain-containing protein [Pseudomonadales bacterium]|nr:PilZ domain-containing protein [Pseudomonadales bacterium]